LICKFDNKKIINEEFIWEFEYIVSNDFLYNLYSCYVNYETEEYDEGERTIIKSNTIINNILEKKYLKNKEILKLIYQVDFTDIELFNKFYYLDIDFETNVTYEDFANIITDRFLLWWIVVIDKNISFETLKKN